MPRNQFIAEKMGDPAVKSARGAPNRAAGRVAWPNG